MKPALRLVTRLLVVALVVATGWAVAVWFGAFGRTEEVGEISGARIPATLVAARGAAQAAASPAGSRQILFGDLHVHTTFSTDAFLQSLPLLGGEGAHPPADACDAARYCAALDFWSINDHAEGLTPTRWRETRETLERCNALAGNPANPDIVAFLGWEWTQIGATPETHYGHKNVILRGRRGDVVPARPIAASGSALDAMRDADLGLRRLAFPLSDFANRQRYYDLDRFLDELQAVPLCEAGVDTRELPDDCSETAATPRELFEKLDQWGVEALVIPHGTTWGNYTPAGVSWDKQLRDGNHDPERQTLLEVYSGHGNSEEYREWRAARRDAGGELVCPEPRDDFLPACWRAGEIIHERCVAAGSEAAECESRAAEARRRYLDEGVDGQRVIPGQRAADWQDADQCRDCFLPTFGLRPGNSAQYALAIEDPDAVGDARRFRFGFIASSDTHTGRPGTGYKEFARFGMTDVAGPRDDTLRKRADGEILDPLPYSVDAPPMPLRAGGNVERSASFLYTGGLVGAHSEGRGRDAIWGALERSEVYGTSGPRILLWFDLLNPPAAAIAAYALPMGGRTRMDGPPRFRARAVGAFRQKPGCPDYAVRGIDPERLAHLCKGECYHPSEQRLAIRRIEVVRIRPGPRSDLPVGQRIEDPWRVFACPGDPAGCVIEFEDEDFAENARDSVYYVRAIQESTSAVNGANLRCRYDASGRCIAVDPCFADARTAASDDCLAEIEERAWSSPIYVDHGAPG